MIRFLLIVGAFLCVATSFAEAGSRALRAVQKDLVQGFYIGGYGSFSFPTVETGQEERTFDDFPTGFGGGGFFGYHVFVPRGFYQLAFALEGDIGVGSASSDDVSASPITKLRLRRYYGLDALFGYKEDFWFIFARGGWHRSRFDGRLSDVAFRRWVHGVRFGAGLEYAPRSRWFVRLEYIRSLHNRQHLANAASFKVTDNRSRFAVGYRF